MKILFSDEVNIALAESLRKHGFLCDIADIRSEQYLIKSISDYEGLIIRGKPTVGHGVFETGTKLRFVARYGSGVEHIDVQSAIKHHIEIIRAPEALAQAVAEYCLGSLIGILRNIPLSSDSLSSGNWERELYRGLELSGKTVGIVGFGNTGSAFANVLQGLQVKVLAYDPYKSEFNNSYIVKSDLNALCAEADIISFHVPLTEETRFFADSDFFSKIRKPIILINTSRGEIVHTKALTHAMKAGKVIGAVLDVHEIEGQNFTSAMLKQDHNLSDSILYLLGHPKTILTPHIAGWSDRSLELIKQVLLRKIIEFHKRMEF